MTMYPKNPETVRITLDRGLTKGEKLARLTSEIPSGEIDQDHVGQRFDNLAERIRQIASPITEAHQEDIIVGYETKRIPVTEINGDLLMVQIFTSFSSDHERFSPVIIADWMLSSEIEKAAASSNRRPVILRENLSKGMLNVGISQKQCEAAKVLVLLEQTVETAEAVLNH